MLPKILVAALAVLALAVPAANARPVDGIHTSSLAGTTSAPRQDLRSPDARDAAREGATAPRPPLVAPARDHSASATDDDGTSPLVYILPGCALALMLAAGAGYALRPSARARRVQA